MDDQGEMTEGEEAAWCAARREDAVRYLAKQKVNHGGVGAAPEWSLPPYVSVWAVDSPKSPGSVGWWVICGDLPTDYCSSAVYRSARWAVRAIAERWKVAAAAVRPWDEAISDSGLPASLAPYLAARAELLLEWTEDPDVWEGMGSRLWRSDGQSGGES
jgi:hypothetical protein